MKQLEKEIHTNGTIYSLVNRSSYKAIYQAKEGQYEVFRIEILPATTLFGNELPEREHYPSSEEFGHIAWCTGNWERALEIYNNLEEKKEDGIQN